MSMFKVRCSETDNRSPFVAMMNWNGFYGVVVAFVKCM